MRLRTKLTLGILTATLATFVAIGFVAIPAAKIALRDRIDDRLRADLAGLRAVVLSPSGALRAGALDTLGEVGDQEYAIVLVDGSTESVLATAGPAGETQPAPEIVGVDELARGDHVAYAEAPDGTTYRYATIDLNDGRFLAVAAPVDDLASLVDDLIRTFSVIGIGAGATLAVVSWWWIRRSTRPIERLTARANAIADGDPDRRINVRTRTAELRQLTNALDTMVVNIDSALAVRTRSEARLRDFIADASHELRTPLTSVSGYLQLDVDGALVDDIQHRHSMGRALAEAARMRRIVADLQVLTELDQDLPFPRASVDVRELVHEAVHDATALDPDRTWSASPADDAMMVRADADQLRQVMVNLVDNVRTHTPAGTAAVVRAGRQGDSIVIEVADNGAGLPESALPAVFERFWRHDPSRSRASGGSGLGLAIVAAIVEAHHGTASASLTPGGGLTVRIELPGDISQRPVDRS